MVASVFKYLAKFEPNFWSLLTLLTLLPPPMGVKMQHTCAEIDYSSPDQVTILPMPNELTLLTLLPPPMGVKMQHTCAEIDYSSPDQVTILPMPNELT
jgi:hypothetical protein